MAEPIKIKFEYQNPENVESEVPGDQELRAATDVSRDSFHQEPVITVTKTEATFTKGDLKLQKVTVTEDISVTFQHLFMKETMPGKTVVTQIQKKSIGRNNSLPGAPAPAIDHGRLRRRHSHVNANGEDKNEEKKPRTKIPVSRFRQTVERVKAERRASRDNKETESHIPIRRSSIPISTSKVPTKPIRKTIVATKAEGTDTTVAKTDVVGATTTITNEANAEVVKANIADAAVTTNNVTEATHTKTKEAGAEVVKTQDADAEDVSTDVADAEVTKTDVTGTTIVTTAKVADTTFTNHDVVDATVVKTDEADVSTTKVTEATVTKTDVVDTIVINTNIPKLIAPEDEFDKLYEEVVHSPTSLNLDISLLNPKVDDPEKLESKFEEIIHDYDENRIQPIDVEKIKKSRIPFLKRRSQQEIDVKGDRSGQIIAARDKVRMRRSSAKSDSVIDGQRQNNTNITVVSDKTVSNEKYFRVNDKSPPVKNEVAIAAAENNVNTVVPSDFDSHNYVKPEKIVKTAINKLKSNGDVEEHVTVVKTVYTQSKSSNEGDVINNKVEHEVIVIDNLKISDEYEVKIESMKEGLVKVIGKLKTDEQDEVKREIANHVEVEETTNISPSSIDKVEHFTTNIDVSTSSKQVMVTSKHNEEEFIKVFGTSTITEVVTSESQIGNTKEQFCEVDSQERELTETLLTNTSNNIEVKTENFDDKFEITKINIEPKTIEVITYTETSFETAAPEKEKLIIVDKQKEIDDIKVLMKEKDSVEDIAKIRGQIGRLISRLDSHEQHEIHKVDLSNDLPKKKSVLSKIALFESHEVKPSLKSKIPKKESKLPKLLTTNIQTTEKVHVHTPLIVEEVIKPFQRITDHNIDVNKVEITTNGDNITGLVKAERFIIESPENIQYGEENKIQIESNTLIIEQSTVSEQVLAPRQFEPKNEDVRDENEQKQILDTPVIVPRYIPVKEVLKRYESINKDSHTNKTIKDIPKVKPISEIIKTLKPEQSPRSLDAMFAHQTTPVTDILKELPERKDLPENNVRGHINEDSNEVFESSDKKYVFKSFKSRDLEYKTMHSNDGNFKTLQYIQDYHNNKNKNDDLLRAKSVELDFGHFKGKVNKMVVRMNSRDILGTTKEAAINMNEMPRKRTVSEKIAMFERKITPIRSELPRPQKAPPKSQVPEELTPEIQARIEELSSAKNYGKVVVPRMTLADGSTMPIIALGTALLDPRLVFHIVCAAIELGYRAIDTAFIYGNEKVVGEAIRAKISDGTVTRDELFIMSKLWSTYHRTDLVQTACQASLDAMGLEYFDLFMIHNPMSLKEGGTALPTIATVLQYSAHDYLDAWFGMETLGARARAIGVSNFNSAQVQRVLDRARVKPVVNQVECHPYLSQQRLGDFCQERNLTLSCFGVLGSKGTPAEFKSGQPATIDDPLLQVMASGLNVSPAQLLIRYQLQCGRQAVVKSSSAAHLWDNLQALNFNLTSAQFEAIRALNRNKRNFTFKGMGDTHKNYPFNAAF